MHATATLMDIYFVNRGAPIHKLPDERNDMFNYEASDLKSGMQLRFANPRPVTEPHPVKRENGRGSGHRCKTLFCVLLNSSHVFHVFDVFF